MPSLGNQVCKVPFPAKLTLEGRLEGWGLVTFEGPWIRSWFPIPTR